VDELAPSKGAFPHAADWAARLGCPLHLVVPFATPVAHDATSPPDQVGACVAKCKGMGVGVEVHSFDGLHQSVVDAEQRPTDLLVVRAHTPALTAVLSGRPASSVLACPETWSPSSRFLLLDDGQGYADAYVDRALQLCRQLRIIPILLTWAPSERAALVRQESVRNMLGSSGPFAVFDTIVGGDLRSAVAGVARWRKCQTVVVCRSPANRWRRWLQTSAAEQVMDLADSLAVLAMPPATVEQPCARPARGLAAAGVSGLPAALLDWLRPIAPGRSPAVRQS